MNDFKEFNNSQNNNSNGWDSSFNTDSYGNQSGWNNSDNNSYNSNNGYCVNPQNSTNQSNIYNSPNYNQYNNQQGLYNSGYNGSNQNGFYNQGYNGNGYDNPGFNAQTDSQKGFLKQFKNLAIEIQRVSQAAKSNSLYGIPQGAEVISIKEEIDFKTPVLIILLIFLGLTSFDLFQTFSKGVNADEISAYIFGIAINSLLISVSLGIALFPIVNGILKMCRCTKKVSAKIVDVKVETSLERDTENRLKEITAYYPIYMFEYASKIYLIEAARNRHLGSPRTGKKLKIRINPNNPQDYYFFSIIRDMLIVLLAFLPAYFLSRANIFI